MNATKSASTIWITPLLGLILVLTLLTTKSSLRASAISNDATSHKLTPPTDGEKISVAFVLTEGTTMIDFAGPWEVFQDVMTSPDNKMVHPFKLFTVSGSKNPIHTSAGMTVVPDYTFENAPPARIVVIPAQNGDPKLADWLRGRDKKSDVVMSVCTGAFQLGEAGLLDGKKATTHHEFYDLFQKSFPNVTLLKGRRFVQSDDVIYTAGGLTSGIDLALHIVEKYYGRDVALQTAKYMEYDSQGWLE
ncbi:MAG TPA: DJ-1/PfpI family protein [Candidatus Acidoferrales bacterium]|nr:DJ-1/PfpI family protein [Candidatus Acidoferrales bacterium]